MAEMELDLKIREAENGFIIIRGDEKRGMKEWIAETKEEARALALEKVGEQIDARAGRGRS